MYAAPAPKLLEAYQNVRDAARDLQLGKASSPALLVDSARSLHWLALVSASEHDRVLARVSEVLRRVKFEEVRDETVNLVSQPILSRAVPLAMTTIARPCTLPGVMMLVLNNEFRFIARLNGILKRISEAIQQQHIERAHLEFHVLKSMALYIGAEELARCAQHLQDASVSGNIPAARVANDRLYAEFEHVRRWVASIYDSEHAQAVRDKSTVSTLIQKQLQHSISMILDAAATKDIKVIGDQAQSLMQMSVCHGPAFDLVAISAYMLQQAACSGNLPLALSHVQPCIDAAMHLLAIRAMLLADDASASSSGPSWAIWIRQAHSTGESFFSEVIQVLLSADHGEDRTKEVISDKRALLHFRGNASVLHRLRAAFLQLLPQWIDCVDHELAVPNLCAYANEAYVVTSLSWLLGMDALFHVGSRMRQAVTQSHATCLCRELAQQARTEIRILIACFCQNWSDPPVFSTTPNGTALEHDGTGRHGGTNSAASASARCAPTPPAPNTPASRKPVVPSPATAAPALAVPSPSVQTPPASTAVASSSIEHQRVALSPAVPLSALHFLLDALVDLQRAASWYVREGGEELRDAELITALELAASAETVFRRVCSK